jgi:hypothetical protein
MHAPDIIRRLAVDARLLADLFEGVTPEEARWKPSPVKWSVLEVLNHLCDEERDDFRTRLRLTLEDAAIEWPPIDPEGWAATRGYNDRDLAHSLADFARERAASVEWLEGLGEVDWDASHRHPAGWTMTAGDLLAAWAAHDLLHFRQIANGRIGFLRQAAAPYSTKYAGGE